jgi:hypothetical protein
VCWQDAILNSGGTFHQSYPNKPWIFSFPA